MKNENIKDIIAENRRRTARLADNYDPISGQGCLGERITVRRRGGKDVLVPATMTADPSYRKQMSAHDFNQLRHRHDFEYWCATCVTVKDKSGYADVRLRLNRPQRIIAGVLERQRTANQPIRAILLKARQLGGSTVVQAYMAWLQLLHRDNWHSLICAHVKDTAQTIRGMMSKLLASYPEEYLPAGEKSLRLTSFEGSHTLLVIESTANGVGNYFHTEWLRAEAGVSDKTAIFVPWYEYGIYTLPVDDYETLWNSLDPYERGLWQRGLSLEQIAWYHAKRREYTTHRAMQAEYPSTADEAFTATDRGVFDTDGIARLRTECRQPASTGEICGNAVKGREALRNVHFTADSAGRLKIWKHPEQSVSTDRYLTIVDIGGRSDTSDYSVIAVVDRHGDGNRPEIVAQWRGHTDHDLLAWNASQIATYYRKSLLIVESNTIETERTEGENSGYILDEIADYYDNVYYRRSGEGSTAMRPGFHTNRQTKPLIVNNLVAAVRDGSYTERDSGAVDELQTYERKPNGTFGAKDGHHDDILMTRCIGLFIAQEMARNGGCDITALKRPFC